MNRRLSALTARRAALQAECALHREDAAQALARVEAGTARVDHILDVGRRLGPVLVVGGLAVVLVAGPQRLLAVVRRAMTWGVYAANAFRLIR